jgi:CRISPR-associated protein Cas2
MYVILMYDIQMDGQGARVRRRLFKTCKQYLHHIQLSAFEGQLDVSEYRVLSEEIKKYVRPVDSVIIFSSMFDKAPSKVLFGKVEDKTSNFL